MAVLYSPGYGAGWSTWNNYTGDTHIECIFDADIATLVLSEKSPGENTERISNLAKEKWGNDFCSFGAKNLMVKWVRLGAEFIITDEDGWESVGLKDKTEWIVA